MKRLGAIVLFAGAVLVSTYILAPAAAPPRPTPVLASELTAIAQAKPVVDAVDAQVDRLRERLANPPAYPRPARDPFRFGERTAPARPKPAVPSAIVERPIMAPPPALPRLVAIATSVIDGSLVRTAVLTMGDDLEIVKVGDRHENFSVGSIGIDVVELIDGDSGKTYRISLH